MYSLEFDIAHMLAGSLVLASFMLIYQDRLYALLNVYALHAFVLALSVAWQAFIQHAPHLYVTAAIALIFKAIIIPVALVAGTTQLSTVANVLSAGVGLRVSLALALFAFMFVAIAENARIPIDNPATHLELTMVHEAMVLEYSGRHLAMIEAASALKLVLYFSLIACLFAPLGIAGPGAGAAAYAVGIAAYLGKLIVLAVLLPIGETSVAKMRVFRYPLFVGSAFAAAALAVFLLFVSKGF